MQFAPVVYNGSLFVYRAGISIASFFNPKAKQWIEGRKDWARSLEQLSTTNGKRIWFHCASLGEFEQARPLMEKWKAERSDDFIILTFFSPSGYEVRKDYRGADAIFYLPLDTPKNVARFIALAKPDLALFVKYEFWYNYLNELKARKIPIVLFSSVFRKSQIFFKRYGGFFKGMLEIFTKIFVQSEESKKLLFSIGIESEVAFDTRFDRVTQIAQNRKSFPLIKKFKAHSKIFIAGSTWRKDEELILKLINDDILPEYKFIIAPHNIHRKNLDELLHCVPDLCRPFSELTEDNATKTKIVVVDSMGNLASLYTYGDIAYIGGGFNAGVHNVLEAAVYGMPLIFGPNYKKSLEAVELNRQMAGFSVRDYDDLEMIIGELADAHQNRLAYTSALTKKYVQEHLGGTEKIYESLKILV